MISVYVHELKKLLDQAMPNLESGVRYRLFLHQFLAGIPSHISKPIRASSDVKSLNQATEQARLLMVVEVDSPSPAAEVNDNTAYSQLQELKGQITELTEQVAMLSTQQRSPHSRSTVTCDNCGEIGHMQHEYPSQCRVCNGRHCFNCWRLAAKLP